jgi:hypothetical protein
MDSVRGTYFASTAFLVFFNFRVRRKALNVRTIRIALFF